MRNNNALDEKRTAAADDLAAEKLMKRTLAEIVAMKKIRLIDKKADWADASDLTHDARRAFFAFGVEIEMTKAGQLRSVAINLDSEHG